MTDRKHPSTLLIGPIVQRDVHDVVKVDDDCIYIDLTGESLVAHTHNFEFVSYYPHHVGRVSHAVAAPIGFAYATTDIIYIAPTGKLAYGYPRSAIALTYHSNRNTFLALTGKDSITEITIDGGISVIGTPGEWHSAIVSSDYSTNIYTICARDPEGVGVSAIQGSTRGRQPPIAKRTIGKFLGCSPSILLMRPDYPDTLSAIFSVGMFAIDWRSSAASMSIVCHRTRCRAAAYINHNVCIIGYRNDMSIIDHRCGLVRTWQTSINIHRMWKIRGGLYVTNIRGDLFTADI